MVSQGLRPKWVWSGRFRRGAEPNVWSGKAAELVIKAHRCPNAEMENSDCHRIERMASVIFLTASSAALMIWVESVSRLGLFVGFHRSPCGNDDPGLPG